MATFDLVNLEKIINNQSDPRVNHYFYKHETSREYIFKCDCCDFETKLYRYDEKKTQNSMIKQKHNIKTHMLSYDHRFNEYYSKGLIPVIPDFESDLINNTFAFFKDHITSVADENGLFWCDLCDVSFKTRKQLYTHLIKSNKKHLVRQVEKEHNAPFKVSVLENRYEITFFQDTIKPEDRAVMDKYKNDDGEYYCKYCYFTPVDDGDFYNHLRSKSHKRNKILDVNSDIYHYTGEKTEYGNLIYKCKKCDCDVNDVVNHHSTH
jgi:hypothetical protein